MTVQYLKWALWPEFGMKIKAQGARHFIISQGG
jgi:hypothetical protein